jgi:hypothetical protein
MTLASGGYVRSTLCDLLHSALSGKFVPKQFHFSLYDFNCYFSPFLFLFHMHAITHSHGYHRSVP